MKINWKHQLVYKGLEKNVSCFNVIHIHIQVPITGLVQFTVTRHDQEILHIAVVFLILFACIEYNFSSFTRQSKLIVSFSEHRYLCFLAHQIRNSVVFKHVR